MDTMTALAAPATARQQSAIITRKSNDGKIAMHDSISKFHLSKTKKSELSTKLGRLL
jgi:hypothetical protein